MRRDRLFFSLAFYILGTAFAAAQNAGHLVNPAEAKTVNEFIPACERDTSLCGFRLGMAVLNKLNTKDAISICLNDAYPQKPVIAWLKAHPETHKMETEDGLYIAYQSLYPCP
jgi:hypothetical protein